MMRVAGKGDDGLAKGLATDNTGRLKVSGGGGLIKVDTNITIPAKSSVRLVTDTDRLFDEVQGEIEFGYRFENEFLNSVKVDHYVRGGSLWIIKSNDYILPTKQRRGGDASFSIKGNRVRVTVYNDSDEDQLLNAYYLRTKSRDSTNESPKGEVKDNSAILGAYDNSSKTVRTLIQNSVEVEQPDAFQMSESLMFREKFDGSEQKLFSRVPPRGAKGFIAMLYIDDTNNTLEDGKGVYLRVNASIYKNTPTSLYATTSKLNKKNDRDVLIWDKGSSEGAIESSGNYLNRVVNLPITNHLTFYLQTNELPEGEYYDITLVVGWLT